MFKIDSILVPTDLSTSARQAMDYAVDLAGRSQAEIHLAYVEVLHGEIVEQVHDRLEDWTKDLPEGLRIARHILRGVVAAPPILDLAEEQDVDLIVMGTHGRRGVGRVLLGSVAAEVVQRSRRAVLTVRGHDPEDEDAAACSFPPSRILVPVDFSASSEVTVRYAKELAAFYGADLALLHIVEDRFHPAFYGPGMMSVYDVDPEIEDKAKVHLTSLYESTPGPSGVFSVHACPGNASREIVERARLLECGLIVIATHGLTGLEHFFLGSVAERVVRLAHCPVFTVKTSVKPLVRGDRDQDSR